ncbi:peptidase S10 family [Rhizoctonia solani]|uniref:Carboxypeptidase n=1 Tax=Rhizoctonia solani TaxID=456999 RepID=A0A8H7I5M3_9AGAM|nr:peptidase S10 family [Rhizoctonia solani]
MFLPLFLIPAIASCGRALTVEQVPLASDQHPSTINPKPSKTIITSKKDCEISVEHVTMSSLPGYQMRVRPSSNLCDPTVKQYSGYLDVSEDKHLFFWFFESRKNPEKAPLAAWMNGGSSALGLLMENGPCNVVFGNSTERNQYGWNEVANMFFLDQPAGVGYSYSTSDHVVDTTWEAARDFYAFVQLFLGCFPEYSGRPFHVLAESYGGQYAPNFANYINPRILGVGTNRQWTGVTSRSSSDLSGICLFRAICVLDNNGPHCKLLRSRVPRLHELFQQCETFRTELTCVPAAIYAFSAMDEGFEPVECYDQMRYAQSYLNSSDVKLALGVPPDFNYNWLNITINSAFFRAADVAHDASLMVKELLDDGVRVLNLAGDADFACNYMGAFEWMYKLDSKYAKEFRPLNNTVWTLNGKAVGEVRASADESGKTAGNFTWLRIYEAGHMVPTTNRKYHWNSLEDGLRISLWLDETK